MCFEMLVPEFWSARRPIKITLGIIQVQMASADKVQVSIRAREVMSKVCDIIKYEVVW